MMRRGRLKEFTIDYLIIVGYLVGLFVIAMACYYLAFQGMPEMTSGQSQLIATVSTVIPAIVVFSVLDYRKPFGTYGKRKAGLKVKYETYAYWRSLVRNIIKFLPWQLAHMGVIAGMYTNFETTSSMVLVYTSMALAVLLLGMVFFRKDGRHLGDMFAGTQVVHIK